MKNLASLAFIGFAFAAAPAIAAPTCPAGLTASTFPSCEIGVAVFEGAAIPEGCFWVTVNTNTYAVVPSNSSGLTDAGSEALMQGLNMGKGEMHVFISDGQPIQSGCALPNVVVKKLGDIQ
jgi:hypothetical protein